MKQMLKLDNLAGGAVQERFNQALKEVMENIADPNTDWKKKRKLTINLTFETKEDRDLTEVTIDTKVSLAPRSSVGTKILIDRDLDGEILGTEFKKQIPGQQAIKVNTDTGEVIDSREEQLEPGLQLVK
ncbi:replication terminator protein [Niameybacter massiliensis]|uniref:Replication terminator protein n=1 Tax=Holtiella tumoricola TaxID=3018743 RepID=A0AA42IYI1_9FIRM|nr:replication terminator protein [Holtiella tumoricola]MDA3730039.1 replication terminator protein [Holtiella tumoricola]